MQIGVEMTMTIGTAIAAIGLILLAIAHSLAGDSGFIRPIIAADWTIDEAPRWAANRLLRVAWHLTSMAWLVMAGIVVGAPPVTAVAIGAIASGLTMLIGLPGHPAWPVFLIAGLAGMWTEDLVPTTAVRAGAVTAAAVAVAASAIHLYWAAGGRRGFDSALPTDPDTGRPTMVPGAWMTVAVAGLLAMFAALLVALAFGHGPATFRWATMAAVAVLAARAIGDGRQVGFSKKDHTTSFAIDDDRFFTPIVVGLAFGGGAALLA